MRPGNFMRYAAEFINKNNDLNNAEHDSENLYKIRANRANGEEQTQNSAFMTRFYGIAVIVAVVVIAGIWLTTRYVSQDVARDVRSWQEKLNLIADSRTAELTRYVSEHFKDIRGLADNPSLQLYLSELNLLAQQNSAIAANSASKESAKKSGSASSASLARNSAPLAQTEYLRNLLVFSAQRGGYKAEGDSSGIPANIAASGKSGLAVVDRNNNIVVSTEMAQNVREQIIIDAAQSERLNEALIDIRKDTDGKLNIGFIVPIYSIQGERNKESQVGKIIAVKTIDDGFFALLKHPGVTEKTLETVLVRSSGNNIQFLNPLLDKSEALAKQIARDARKFAEAKLMTNIGDFSAELNDYANRRVLATSRLVAGTPWIAIVKINRDEALAASAKTRNNMIAIFFLAIAAIVLLIVALWWHGNSKRSLMLSYHFRRLAAQAQAQEEMLRLVSDNQPEAVFILDADFRYCFANRSAAVRAGMKAETLPGKYLQDVRGAVSARHIAMKCEEAFDKKHIMLHFFQDVIAGNSRSIQGIYVPVVHIPISGLEFPTPGVLVVEQDITEAVNEREKRLQILQDLVDTLISLVDRRDPFAANHSLLVSGLAESVAFQMDLDEVTVETARIAAGLMNVGKIVVSADILTKTGKLDDEERQIIRDCLSDAAELVKLIHFEGPVYETLRQWQERFDGSGPLGIIGDNILLPARILAVANAFIGMISPRSWRTALSADEAISFLMNNSNSLFDRKVVVALVHFVENQKGRIWLDEMLSDRKAA